MQGISKIKKIYPIPNIAPISNIAPIQYNYSYKQKPVSNVSNYNDPFEINSVADVILTSFQTGKDNKMKTKYNTGLLGVPVVNILPRYFEYLNRYTFQPISQGDWGTVAKNTLTGGMETLDAIANPFKALLQGKNPLDALGWGTEGRQNFDWDTGNMIADIVLEVLSDPMTYVGGTGIWKQTLKLNKATQIADVFFDALGDVGRAWAKEVGPEVAKRNLKKVIKRGINAVVRGESDDLISAIVKSASKAAESGHTVRKFMNIDFPEAVIRGLKNIASEEIDTASMHIIQNTIASTKTQLKIIKGFEAVDDTAAGLGFFGATPISGLWYSGKAVKAISEYRHAQVDRVLQGFVRADGSINLMEFAEALRKGGDSLTSLNKSYARVVKGNPNLKGVSLTMLIQRNAMADMYALQGVLSKYATSKDAGKLIRDIDNLMNKRFGTTLEGYLDNLKIINEATDDSFSFVTKQFESVQDIVKKANKVVEDNKALADIDYKLRPIENAIDKLEQTQSRFIDFEDPDISFNAVDDLVSGDSDINKAIDDIFLELQVERDALRKMSTAPTSSPIIELAVEQAVEQAVKQATERYKPGTFKVKGSVKEAISEAIQGVSDATRSKATREFAGRYKEIYDSVVAMLIRNGVYNPQLMRAGAFQTLIDDYIFEYMDDFIAGKEFWKYNKTEFNFNTFKKPYEKWRKANKVVNPTIHEANVIRAKLKEHPFFKQIRDINLENAKPSVRQRYNQLYNQFIDMLTGIVQDHMRNTDEILYAAKIDRIIKNDNIVDALFDGILSPMIEIVKDEAKTLSGFKPVLDGEIMSQSIKLLNSVDESGVYLQTKIMDIIKKHALKNSAKDAMDSPVTWLILESDHETVTNAILDLFITGDIDEAGDIIKSTNKKAVDLVSDAKKIRPEDAEEAIRNIDAWIDKYVDKTKVNLTGEMLYNDILEFANVSVYNVHENGMRVLNQEELMGVYNKLKRNIQMLQFNLLEGVQDENTKLLDAILKELSELDLVEFISNNINVAFDEVYYVAKQEQAYNSLMFLMQDSETGELIQDMYNNQRTGLGYTIHKWATQTITAETPEFERNMIMTSKNILEHSKGLVDYKGFIQTLMGDTNLPEEVKTAMLSVIQNYATKSIKSINDDFDGVMKDLFDKIQDGYQGSKTKKRSYKLDDWRGKFPETPDEWAALKPGDFWYDVQKMLPSGTKLTPEMAHRSDFDTLTSKWFLENVLEEKMAPNHYVLDIETLGQDPAKHAAFEHSITDHQGNTTKTLLNLDTSNTNIPQDAVTDVWGTDWDSLKKAQSPATHDSSLDVAQNVKWLDDEEQYWLDFARFCKDNYSPGASFITHNGTMFDMPFILEKLRRFNIPTEDVEKWGMIDTLHKIKVKDDVFELTDVHKEKLTQLMRGYLTMRVFNGHENLKLIDSINTDLIDDLRDLQKLMSLDDDMKFKLQSMATAMDEARRAGDVDGVKMIEAERDAMFSNVKPGMDMADVAYAHALSKKLVTALSEDISKINKQLRSFSFSNKTIEDAEFKKDMKAVFLDMIKSGNDADPHMMDSGNKIKRVLERDYPEFFQNLPEPSFNNPFPRYTAYEQALDAWFEYTNTSKMLYGFTEGVNLYGTKKIGDMKNIKEWFDIVEDETLDASVSAAMQKITNKINRRYEYIKNPKVLEGSEEDLDMLLRIYLSAPDELLNPVLKRLRTDKLDVVSKYALTSYLADYVEHKCKLLKRPDYLTSALDDMQKGPILIDKISKAVQSKKLMTITEIEDFYEQTLKIGGPEIEELQQELSHLITKTHNANYYQTLKAEDEFLQAMEHSLEQRYTQNKSYLLNVRKRDIDLEIAAANKELSELFSKANDIDWYTDHGFQDAFIVKSEQLSKQITQKQSELAQVYTQLEALTKRYESEYTKYAKQRSAVSVRLHDFAINDRAAYVRIQNLTQKINVSTKGYRVGEHRYILNEVSQLLQKGSLTNYDLLELLEMLNKSNDPRLYDLKRQASTVLNKTNSTLGNIAEEYNRVSNAAIAQEAFVRKLTQELADEKTLYATVFEPINIKIKEFDEQIEQLSKRIKHAETELAPTGTTHKNYVKLLEDFKAGRVSRKQVADYFANVWQPLEVDSRMLYSTINDVKLNKLNYENSIDYSHMKIQFKIKQDTLYMQLEHAQEYLKELVDDAQQLQHEAKRGIKHVEPTEVTAMLDMIQALDDTAVKDTFEELLEIVKHPKKLTHSPIPGTDLTNVEYAALKTYDEAVYKVNGLKAVTDELQQSIDNLNKLGDSLDFNEVFKPSTRRLSTGMVRTHNMLRKFTEAYNALTYEQQSKVFNMLNNIQDTIKVKVTLPQILHMAQDPVQLRNWLAFNGTVATFNMKDLSILGSTAVKVGDEVKPRTIVELVALVNDQTKALNDVGVEVKVVDNRYYFILTPNKDAKLRIDWDDMSNSYKWYLGEEEIQRPLLKDPDLHTIFSEIGLDKFPGFEDFADYVMDVRHNLNYYSKDLSAGSSGDILTVDMFKDIYQNLPKEVQDSMYDLATITSGKYYSSPMYNFVNLGSLRYQKEMQEYIPKSMLSSLIHASEVSVRNADNTLQYLNEWFDGTMRINVGEWAKPKYDTDWLQGLKDHPEYCLAVVHQDAKSSKGYAVRALTIRNADDLANARRLNAVLMTRQQLGKIIGVVNESAFNHGFLKVWADVMRVYKAGYLFNPGVWMRNYLDSTIKTMVTTETFVETLRAQRTAKTMLKEYDNSLDQLLYVGRINIDKIEQLARLYGKTVDDVLSDINLKSADLKSECLHSIIDATKLMNEYHTAVEDIINMDANKVFNTKNVDFYFSHMSKNFDKESFLTVHNYIIDSPSGGPTPILQSYYDGLMKAKRGIDNQAGVSTTIDTMMDLAMRPNQNIEQIIRLAQHLIQLKQGMNFTESAYKIAQTHFDYALKTDVNRVIELFIPFYTFKMRNLEYWVDQAMDKPWLLRTLSNIYTPVFDLDSYDFYEYANNKSLEYQILSGNIPLTSDGMTLKVNPSSMDTFNMLTDPLGSFKSSMFGPFQTTIELLLEQRLRATGGEAAQDGFMNFMNNSLGISDYGAANSDPVNELIKQLPVVGTGIQKVQQAQNYYSRTGKLANLVAPDLFGATSRWQPKQFNNTNYRSKTQKQSKSRKGSSRRHYAKRSYYRKPYLPYKQWDYQPSERRNYVRDVYTNWWHRPKPVKYVNIYEKYYSQKGKRRMDTMLVPTTPKNLMWKLREMHRYYRS